MIKIGAVKIPHIDVHGMLTRQIEPRIQYLPRDILATAEHSMIGMIHSDVDPIVAIGSANYIYVPPGNNNAKVNRFGTLRVPLENNPHDVITHLPDLKVFTCSHALPPPR